MMDDARTNWFLTTGLQFFWPAWIIAIGVEIAIFCCPGVRRKVPLNYILLLIFTVSFGWLIGLITVMKGQGRPEIVL